MCLRTMFVTHNHMGFMTNVLAVTMVGGEWGVEAKNSAIRLAVLYACS